MIIIIIIIITPSPWQFKVDQKILGFPAFIAKTFNRVFCYCLNIIIIVI